MADICTNTVESIFKKEITFSECQNAMLNKQFKKDFLLFYVDLVYNVFRTIFEFFCEHGVLIFLAVVIYYIVYRSYVNPLLNIKELTEMGFKHIAAGPNRDRHITRAQTLRKMGSNIPPPYPNGWFAVAESRELKVGGVTAVDALGQNLCVYRGEDGVARCVDAYCPHLGANLGVGGSVCGNCIECPFHKWRFGEDGACVNVPGEEHAPKGVSIKQWPTVEVDGAVLIWYDAENRDPLWNITELEELKSWGCRGRSETIVSVHIQEISENGADLAHFDTLHSTSLVSIFGEKYSFLNDFIGSVVWSARWTKGDEDHTVTVNVKQNYKILKHNLCSFDFEITQMGPGFHRVFIQSTFGPLLVSQSVTPIGPLLQRVIHRVYSPTYNAPLAALVVQFGGAVFLGLKKYSFEWVLGGQLIIEGHCLHIMMIEHHLQFEQDVAIWNSKRFVSAPPYVRVDKMIRAYRTWFSQFYSPHSVSFREASQNTLDW